MRIFFSCINSIFLPPPTAPSNKPLKSALKKTPLVKKQELEPLFKAREYGGFPYQYDKMLLINKKVIQKHTIQKMTQIRGKEVRYELTIRP